MGKRNKKHMKKLLKETGIEKAPENFTQHVMKDVFISLNEEGLKDQRLAQILKTQSLEMPSDTFVSNVMEEVKMREDLEYKPLISKKGWFAICGFIVALMMFVLFKETPQESTSIYTKVTPYLEEAKNIFSNPLEGRTFFKETQLSPILTMSLFCLISMLLFDIKLRKRLIN